MSPAPHSPPRSAPLSGLTSPRAARRTIVALALCLALAAGLLIGRWTAPESGKPTEQLRAQICVLLDELGADSSGPADRLACPPR